MQNGFSLHSIATLVKVQTLMLKGQDFILNEFDQLHDSVRR